jgi:hypothetical protein
MKETVHTPQSNEEKEPYYVAFERSRNPAHARKEHEDCSEESNDRNLQAMYIFDKGTLLEKRRDCLAFIREIPIHEPNKSGRTDFQGNPIPQFDMTTYIVSGYLVADREAHAIYHFSHETWDFPEPVYRAYSLLEEARFLRSYYEDEDETDKASTEDEVLEKTEPYFMVKEDSFNPDYMEDSDEDEDENEDENEDGIERRVQEWEFPYSGDISPSATYCYYSDLIQLYHPFTEGTLLEKRCKCLKLVIALMHAEPDEPGRHDHNTLPDGKPIPDFHLDTYCVRGFMVDNDTTYLFFYFANDYGMKPQVFADDLLKETKYMIRYYESDKNAPVASDEAEN